MTDQNLTLQDQGGQALAEKIGTWSTLEPSQRKSRLVALGRSGPPDEVEIRLSRLEVLHDEGQISTPDFCLLVRVASSAPTAIRILRTRAESEILFAAIHVVRIHWRRTPDAERLLSACQGASGLIEIIKSLPVRVARQLLRAFHTAGSVGANVSLQTQTVDFIIRSAIPFLNPDPNFPTPIRRLAFSMLDTVVPSASPPVIRALIPHWKKMIPPRTWKRLAKIYPKLTSELIFIQLGDQLEQSEQWANGGLLPHFQDLSPAVEALCNRSSDGVDFLWKCLTTYASYIQEVEDATRGDIFGPRDSVLVYLWYSGLTDRLLKIRGKGENGLRFALDLLDLYKGIHNQQKMREWGWNDILPILNFALHQFARRREEWTLPPGDPQSTNNRDVPTAIAVIHTVFKNFQQARFSLGCPETHLFQVLHCLPIEARFPFLVTAYFACFSVDLTDESIDPPHICVSLLFLLERSMGENLLRRMVDAHDNLSIWNPRLLSPASTTFGALFRIASSPIIGTEHIRDTKMAVLRAAWVDSEIRCLTFGDIYGSSLAQAVEAVKRDVLSFKGISSRSKTGPKRLAFLEIIIAITVKTQEMDLLNASLAFAIKRFAKDPDAGIGIWRYLSKDEAFLDVLSRWFVVRPGQGDMAMQSYVTQLKAHFESVGRVIRTLKELLEVLIQEPGLVSQAADLWTNYGTLLGKVIAKRLDFLSTLPKSVLTQKGLGAAVFGDLSPLVLSHGMARISATPVPLEIQTTGIHVSQELLHIFIPWVDGLGMERERLYRNAHSSGKLQKNTVSKRFWPLPVSLPEIDVLPPDNGLDYSLEATFFYRSLESWLFSPHVIFLSKPTNDFDPFSGSSKLHAYVQQYLKLSHGQADITRKIERLLAHYGTPSSPEPSGEVWDDHSLLILAIPEVRDQIVRSPQLFGPFIDKMLPHYSHQKQDRQAGLFVTLSSVPSLPLVDKETVLGSSIAPIDDNSRANIYTNLLWGITTFGHAFFSTHTLERLAVLAVAWIGTTLDLPLQTELEIKGPISYALRSVRLDKSPAGQEVHCLTLALPYISTSEIKLLVDAITSLPITPHTLPIALSLIGALRKHRKTLIAVDLSFYILADMESSSWHRHTLTQTILKDLRPVDVDTVMHRFLELLTTRRRQQLQLEAQDKEQSIQDTQVDTHATAGNVLKPLLKISTLKMFLQLIFRGIENGVFLDDAFTLAHKMMDISSHPSVLQVVITIAVEVIRVDESIPTSGPAPQSHDGNVWITLQSLAQTGARLAENTSITDKDWEAIRRRDASMPHIDTSHPIATTLLEVSLAKIPSGARNRWIEVVVLPLLAGQINNRSLWLEVAVSHEGGSQKDVDLIWGTYDDTFNVLPILRQILDHAVPKLTAKSLDTLLTLIKRRLCTRTTRQSFDFLSNTTRKNYKGNEEEAKPFLDGVRLLTRHALSDDSAAFNQAVSTIIHGIITKNIDSVIVTQLSSLLERTGQSLLSPKHMLVGHDPRKQTAPFSIFQSLLLSLAPDIRTPDNISWNERIRPLLEKFLDNAKRLEQEQSALFRHGGACYWPVLILLKVLLLPHPFVESYSSAPDKAEKYARGLADLASEILEFPGYHLILRDYLLLPITSWLLPGAEDVVPICVALTTASPYGSGKPELRVVCFQMAIELEKASRTNHPSAERKRLVNRWYEDEDGLVRNMALQFGG